MNLSALASLSGNNGVSIRHPHSPGVTHFGLLLIGFQTAPAPSARVRHKREKAP
jgi:hypothetical protein